MVIFNINVGWSINRPFRMSIYEFNLALVDINGNAQLGLLASDNYVIRVRNLPKNMIFGEELL